jgi:hypothetical protein
MDQRFSHWIGLRQQIENALQIQIGKFAITAPLERRAVELIDGVSGGVEHGVDGVTGLPPGADPMTLGVCTQTTPGVRG